MITNIDINKGSAYKIRKAALIIGIIAVIGIFIWNVMHLSAVSSVEVGVITKKEDMANYMKLSMDMIKVARWIAIVSIFLSLSVACLLLAHSVMQMIRINKFNLKSVLATGIINAIMGIVILVFTILALTLVFDIEKWGFIMVYSDEFEVWRFASFGSKINYVFAYMGIIFATVLYATIYAGAFNRPGLNGKDENVKMIRTVALFAFSAIMIAIVVLGPLFNYGFRNMYDIQEELSKAKSHDDIVKYTQQLRGAEASIYQDKYALGIIGATAISTLTLIPCIIFANKDKAQMTKYIVVYSILGAITLILLCIAASLIKMGDLETLAERIIKEERLPKWYVDTKTGSAMVLISYLVALGSSITTFAMTKKLDPKAKKVAVAAKAA